MSFEVWLHPKADAFLDSLDSVLKKKIKDKLRELSEEPNKKGKQLTSSFFRMRIGKYRAIYEILWDELRVNVLFIGHRDHVYDDFEKLL